MEGSRDWIGDEKEARLEGEKSTGLAVECIIPLMRRPEQPAASELKLGPPSSPDVAFSQRRCGLASTRADTRHSIPRAHFAPERDGSSGYGVFFARVPRAARQSQ
jgi:hypothetical protein